APLCRPPSLPTRRSCELPRCGPIERRWVAGGSGTRVAVPWRLLAAEHTAHPVELGPERVLVGGVLLPPGHPEPGRELAMAALAAAATVLPHQLGAGRGRAEPGRGLQDAQSVEGGGVPAALRHHPPPPGLLAVGVAVAFQPDQGHPAALGVTGRIADL